MTNDQQVNVQKFTRGLRAIADFYDTHPELPLPQESYVGLKIYSADTRAKVEPIVRAFGTCAKSSDDQFFRFSRDFNGVSLMVTAFRNALCERVVTGKRIVTKAVEIVPAVTEQREIEEEIVVWKCPEILRPEEVAV